MPRRPHPGVPALRRVLEDLRARAEACRGPWHVELWPDGGTIAWRVEPGPVDRHDLRVEQATWSPEALRRRVIESLPAGFAPIRFTRGLGSVFVRLGRPRDRCARCDEPMDDTARWMLVEECSGCALEMGILIGA